jgi:hypothetical protein
MNQSQVPSPNALRSLTCVLPSVCLSVAVRRSTCPLLLRTNTTQSLSDHLCPFCVTALTLSPRRRDLLDYLWLTLQSFSAPHFLGALSLFHRRSCYISHFASSPVTRGVANSWNICTELRFQWKNSKHFFFFSVLKTRGRMTMWWISWSEFTSRLQSDKPPAQYSHAPHYEVSVNVGQLIRRWSHQTIILQYNNIIVLQLPYSIQYSNMLYRFVA